MSLNISINELTQPTIEINNSISDLSNNIKRYLDISFNKDTKAQVEDKYYTFKNQYDLILNTLRSVYANANTQTTLKDIGRHQQQNIALKSTLKTKQEELALADARLESISTRYEAPSYAQTIGAIFRPFRKISYLIIVPLIFLMILTSFWLLRPDSISQIQNIKLPGINIGSNPFAGASAPSINNGFNKNIAALAKLR